MKAIKVMLMALAFGAAAPVMAQDDDFEPTFAFVNSDGVAYENNAVITVTEVEDDGMGTVQIPSGLAVKNLTEDEAPISMDVKITHIDGGSLSVCFPQNCFTYPTPAGALEGNQQNYVMAGGEVKDMATEFILSEEFGECEVEFQLLLMDYFNGNYSLLDNDSKITVKFTNKPTGIKNINAGAAAGMAAEHYNLAGQRVAEGAKGVHVVKQANGKSVKMIVR